MRLALTACIALVAVSRPAWANPSARLVYSRSSDAASCPDEESLRRAVAARFGYDPFFPWATQAVVAQVWRGGHRFRSRIQVVDSHGVAIGTRELSSDRDDCSELFDATALAISIALDASAKLEPDSADPPVPVAAPPPAPSPAAPPPPVEPTHEPAVPVPMAPTLRPFAGLDLLGSAGSAPSPSLGGAAFLGLRLRALSAAVEARVDAPSSTSVSARGSVTSWLYAATLAPCLHFGPGSACLLASLGQVRAFSSGVTTSSSGTALFAAVGWRIGVELPLSEALALRAHADLLVNVDPYGLSLSGLPVWSSSPVSGTLGAGVVVRFP